MKGQILETVKHPNRKFMPELLPLNKRGRSGSVLELGDLKQSETKEHASIALNLRQKKNEMSQAIQQEKIKRLHEDYFISLVECGVNIPKEKIELFKTLFLKHYKTQLIFQNLQDPKEQVEKDHQNLTKFCTKDGKKFMEPEEFDQYLKNIKMQRLMNKNEQVVVNLVKSCQSNYNFSNNLFNEDREYLEQLAKDIARKLRMHFNAGQKEEYEKQIRIRKMYLARKLLNKNDEKKKESDSSSDFSLTTETEEELPIIKVLNQDLKSLNQGSNIKNRKSLRNITTKSDNNSPILKSLSTINFGGSPMLKSPSRMKFSKLGSGGTTARPIKKFRESFTIKESTFNKIMSRKNSNEVTPEGNKRKIKQPPTPSDAFLEPKDMTLENLQKSMDLLKFRRESSMSKKKSSYIKDYIKSLKNPSKEESLEMLAFLDKVQSDHKMKHLLSSKSIEKYTKVFEKKFLGRNLDRKDKKNATSLESRYDMYGDKFLDYIEDISKAPEKLSKQYLRKMEVDFRNFRNMNSKFK
ncbi:unnamed protein product [Moneuplotes crassus]|uniref:Uncharacterized protein n=1 Tax=Euplotes crassus TaxID=5936 RepID=A0AAD1U372_EUPCR|nr:unnamed protein product [Moneuplotes crassus]